MNNKPNSRKRPRQYMTWGEPDEEKELPVPRRTLLRKLQPVDNIEEESSKRARLSHAEFEGWNDDNCSSLRYPDHRASETLNDETRTTFSTPSHENDGGSGVSTVRLSSSESGDYQDLDVDETFEVESLASNNDYRENEGGSEVSTVRVSSSESGDSSSVIASSDDDQDPEENQESDFIPITTLTQGQQNSITSDEDLLSPADDGPMEVPHPTETSCTPNPVAASARGTPFYSTLRRLNQLPAEITSNVCLSPREILLNLLNLNAAHDVNNSVFIGMCKLLNSIFSEPILPDTQFKLDQLLFSSCGAEYHFYCSKCERLLRVTDLTQSLTCKCGHVNNNFSDLTKASFFVTFDVCTQLEILLRDPKISVQLLDAKSYKRVGPGIRDLWDGELYQNFISSLNPSDVAKILSLVACIDGSPLFNSSGTEIHPLIATVNELPPALRLRKTLLLGLWCGKGKPNFKSFLKPLRRSIVKLSSSGANISIGGQKTHVKVYLIGCCVDAALRGPIQGIHLHNGAFGCNWCLHPGETEGGGSSARKYACIEPSPAKRTHDEVVQDAEKVKKLPPVAPTAPKPHVNGVLGLSPLLKFPHFNIVDGMVLDSMHNFFLGTTRQFLRLWFGLEGNIRLPDNRVPDYYIGSPSALPKVNKRIALLCPPVETRRLPRSMSDIAWIKSRELENWLIYFLFPVLNGILPDKFLRHFALYIQSIYLLMKDNILDEDLTLAEKLLDRFVEDIKNLYRNPNCSDLKQYTYNVHLSVHAVQNAKKWGPAWSVSGYAYENGIGELKNAVYANRGIPDQITRSICKTTIKDLLSQEIHSAGCASFLNAITPSKGVNVSFIGNVKVFGIDYELFKPNDEESYLLNQSSLSAKDFCAAKKIIYNSCVFAPRIRETRTRNDFVQLTDGQIVQVKKIIVSERFEVVLYFYSIVHLKPVPIYMFPHLSTQSPFIYNVELIEQELYLKPHQTLSKPCVYSDLRSVGADETISVMANVMNIV